MTMWEIDTKIENIIDKHVKEVPYEGKEVDKYGMKGAIMEFIAELEFNDLLKIKETKGK